ncbi:MAG: GNAT family N-acetyltransferase [bacterium]|nr:GNAT family N-acetyltransferase [bacterium]
MTIVDIATQKNINELTSLTKKMIDYHHGLDNYYKPAKDYIELESVLSAWLNDKNIKIWLAKNNKQTIGYLRAGIEDAPLYMATDKIGLIYDIFVEPDKRRSGAAKQLFQEALNWFANNKIRHIELDVDERNRPAIEFWRSLGFKDYKKRMRLD